MQMTSDETQIQIYADWPMSHAECVTKDNRKNPEYQVVVTIRRLLTDSFCLMMHQLPDLFTILKLYELSNCEPLLWTTLPALCQITSLIVQNIIIIISN